MNDKTYIAIDLKSFYASVECVERHLDPLTTHLVVADESRTDKTICLAVSPSLKAYGLSGRCRLFEAKQKVKAINQQRFQRNHYQKFIGQSYDDTELKNNQKLELNMLIATPRMAHYIEYSTQIYRIYLKYVAPEDIHVYSIDEVFIDATPYLKSMNMSAHQFAMTIIQDVLLTTGITATAGIGPNLYLCKVAMDIWAKHQKADADGVRIAELDVMSYRRYLWNHKPITDFWRVGRGYSKKLADHGMHTMGDVARCSLVNEDLLYQLFGINAELLIDHAWGYETCTMADIKQYQPENSSLGAGQVLTSPYTYYQARTVLKEMAESLALDLVEKHLVCNQVVLSIGYDASSIDDYFTGKISTDYYGRQVPKGVHGSANLPQFTSSTKLITDAFLSIYDHLVPHHLMIRRLSVTANHIVDENKKPVIHRVEQLSLFAPVKEEPIIDEEALNKEKTLQKTMIAIKDKYGKNAVLKGTSFEDGATARERNKQIGGHKA